ncbi:unnamed protein product [Brugia timori]|uniref:Uncharacterized protein n=1 Tax=Brugia timori TaxID=42155 RepID=A0A0R3R178_9BILA|nr:unnamed protein product [Brugia timori]
MHAPNKVKSSINRMLLILRKLLFLSFPYYPVMIQLTFS